MTDTHKARTVAISKLHASETQTLKCLSLIKDMSKLLSSASVDGASDLLERAEALRYGLRTDLPNYILMERTLQAVAAHLASEGGHEVPLA